MARKRKRRRTAAQRRATAKMIAANRRTRRAGKKRRRTMRRKSAPNVVIVQNPTGGRMAKRARKRRSAPRRKRRVTRARVRRNPPRRRAGRRRSFRRNPPVFRIIRDGAVQGLAGLAGSAAVRYAAKLVPAQSNAYVASGVDLALGAAVAFAAGRLKLGANVSTAIATGAMMRAYESILKRHLPPEVTAPLLGEDRYYGITPGGSGIPGGYGTAGVGLYPTARAAIASGVPDMGLYPGADVVSEDYTY